MTQIEGVLIRNDQCHRKGRYDPSLELAFALAEFFECAIEDIFNPHTE
jgi:putative transcriptional regulator